MRGPGRNDAIRQRLRDHERERAQVAVAETMVPADEEPAADWKQRLRQRLADHERERAPGAPQAQAAEGASLPVFASRFRPIRELGRGGMGVVIEAEDTTLGRRVALKVLLERALASPQALERFEFEARAAARLRHPNVVAVHEVGEQCGQRYLVMDLIEGRSLAELLAEQGPLDEREAAGIALTVSRALAHAHSESILHRDVKPGNVLITPAGQPLLTDFGLAKDVERSVDVTASGQAMGTPAYMPPEQALGQRERIDRRADVYALGATLFHMLTGRPPFVSDSALSVLRQVVDDEPPTPSKIAQRRIDRDLETICLTCLEKEPERRYDSASDLADDLERFLTHQPIAARRASAWERLAKWRQRNRGVARTLTGSVLVLLALSMGGTALFLQRLRRERDLARAAAQEARQALDLFVFEVREQLQDLPSQQARQARSRLLAVAVKRQLRLQELEALAGFDEPTLREPEAYVQIGDLALDAGESQVALTAYRKALAANRELYATAPHPEYARSLAVSLLRISRTLRRLGESKQAPALTREALSVLEGLPGTFETGQAQSFAWVELGDLHIDRGEHGAAAEAFESALKIARSVAERAKRHPDTLRTLSVALDRLGELRRTLGDLDQARALLEEALDVSRSLNKVDPGKRSRRDLYVSFTRIGDLRLTAGDHEGAAAAYRGALELGRLAHQADRDNANIRLDLSYCLQQVALAAGRSGGYDEAGEHFAEALVLLRGVRRQDPTSAEPQRRLARLLDHMADHARQGNTLGQADAYYRESLGLVRALAAADRHSASAQRDLAVSWLNVGDVERLQGELGAAQQSYQRALELQEELAGATRTAMARDDLANVLSRLGRVRAVQGDREEAHQRLDAALELHQTLHRERPDDAEVRSHLAVTLTQLGDLVYGEHRYQVTIDHCREAIGHLQALEALDPSSATVARRHASALGLEAKALLALERRDEARASAEGAVQRRRRASKVSGGRGDRRELAVALGTLAMLQDDPAVRAETQREVVGVHRDLLALDPNRFSLARDLATALSRLADQRQSEGELEQSQALWEEALEPLRVAAEANPRNPLAQEDMGLFLQRLGMVQQARGEYAAAEAGLAEAVEHVRPLGLERPGARQTMARALLGLGSLRFRAEDLEGARTYWTEGLAVSRLRLEREPESLSTRRDLSIALLKLYNVRRIEQDVAGGLALLDDAVANHRVLVAAAPRYAPELAQYERLQASQRDRQQLLTGARAPRGAGEQLALAYHCLADPARAAEALAAFRAALRDPEAATPRHLYNAACAAGRVLAVGPQPALRAEALGWLAQQLAQRRAHLQDLSADERTSAAAAMNEHRLAARGDPDLAPLLGDPEFEALYPAD